MSQRSKLGGVSQATLRRSWIVFFLWLGAVVAANRLAPRPFWLWYGCLVGAALTIFLIHRRHWFAGPLGFIVTGSLVSYLLPGLASQWLWVLSTPMHPLTSASPTWPDIGWLLFRTLQLFAPAAILVRHVASRHRILLAFDDTQLEPRRRWMPDPSSYYLVTQR
jgi:hypothetical protein